MSRRVGDRWVGGGPVGESMVGGPWNTCRLVSGRLSVVSASVEHISVGRWSIVGGRWSVVL